MGATSYLIDNAEQLQKEWFDNMNNIGLTAGASAPEVLIQQVVARLREWGGKIPLEITGREENVVFTMPKELRIPLANI
jgi:4-hydroxy-3-methylbut-2-enyl diphosphate reductase